MPTGLVQTNIWSTAGTEFLHGTHCGPDATEHTGRLTNIWTCLHRTFRALDGSHSTHPLTGPRQRPAGLVAPDSPLDLLGRRAAPPYAG